jgi:hypothetical protein
MSDRPVSFHVAEIRKIVDFDLFFEELNAYITVHQIPFPLLCNDRREAFEDFERLKWCKTEAVFQSSPWNHAFGYAWPLSSCMLGLHLIGNKASSYFNEDVRSRLTSKLPSAQSIWNDPVKRLSAMKILKLQLQSHPRAFTLRKVGNAIRQRGTYAAQFRPSAAKAIYERFAAKDVFDFSMGWGDRLVGAMASPRVVSYTGCDPNLDMHGIYESMISAYGTTSFRHAFFPVPAEDLHAFPADSFDLVLTSPPYFDCERYAEGTNHVDRQSWWRYRTPAEWLGSFLLPAIRVAWFALRPGGHMVINLADIKKNKQVIKLCDPMNDYIQELPGARYVDCIGYKMNRRTNAGGREEGKMYGEPVWVWTKA